MIGSGGLGQAAIRLPRHPSPTLVIALDVTEDPPDFAKSVGAHEAVLSKDLAAEGARTGHAHRCAHPL
ncbi:hypothetical protein [Nocardia aurantiaca]|uniref:Uncharacterized protein n=1 Tax=Nocardia aurantiaca TaxID=2675850 RepID=A0A6I3L1B9_9NOCA|nr:hypothetical protein [Nocardia aurantiaca]